MTQPHDVAAVAHASGEAGDPPIRAPDASSVPTETLRHHISQAITGKDLNSVSVSELRHQVAQSLLLPADGLDSRKKEFKKLTEDVVRELGVITTVPLINQLLTAAKEPDNALQQVYLVTISRVLATTDDGQQAFKDLTTMTRQDVATAIRLAFDNPLQTGTRAGRPRAAPPPGDDTTTSLLQFVVVFQERHMDGSMHFHAVVKLRRQFRFLNAKRTLRERDGLPSHWSCSHSQVWSAMRYLHIGTPTKPEVDESPWCWSASGEKLDLFAMSQEPFQAEAWRKRRESEARKGSVEQGGAKKGRTVSKLDITALILSKKLHSKDKLMAYVQEHGTAAMQTYVHKNQRKLTQDIADALEWSMARGSAELETKTDWELLQQCAGDGCPCAYLSGANS